MLFSKKKAKKVVKDPIKDKYNQKTGFFAVIKRNFFNVVNSIKGLKSLKGEAILALKLCGEVLLYGVLGGLGLTLFGVPFSIMTVLASGSALWLIDNKLEGFLTRVLGSLSLVRVYK